MVEPVTLQTLLTYLTLISVPVGVLYHIMTLRNTRKNQQLTLETRQAQIFMNIYNNSFNNPQFWEYFQTIRLLQWKDLDEYQAVFDYINPETRDNRLAISMILGFYEGVGVLVKENLLDIRMVALLMTGQTKDFREKIESIVEEARKYYNYPRFVSETEYLYDELMKYIEEHPEIKT